MKQIISTIVLACLFIAGCGDANDKTADKNVSSLTYIENKEQIETLVRQMYQWHWTDSMDIGMKTVKDDRDSLYIGIDFTEHKRRLEKLSQTGFFADEFLDNYDKIAHTIDAKLKNGEYVWEVGDLPPFGNDANDWCDCQDYPDVEPWNEIRFIFSEVTNEIASLAWTWKNPEWSKDFDYKMRVVKEHGKWKIAYMERFDLDIYK